MPFHDGGMPTTPIVLASGAHLGGAGERAALHDPFQLPLRPAVCLHQCCSRPATGLGREESPGSSPQLMPKVCPAPAPGRTCSMSDELALPFDSKQPVSVLSTGRSRGQPSLGSSPLSCTACQPDTWKYPSPHPSLSNTSQRFQKTASSSQAGVRGNTL